MITKRAAFLHVKEILGEKKKFEANKILHMEKIKHIKMTNLHCWPFKVIVSLLILWLEQMRLSPHLFCITMTRSTWPNVAQSSVQGPAACIWDVMRHDTNSPEGYPCRSGETLSWLSGSAWSSFKSSGPRTAVITHRNERSADADSFEQSPWISLSRYLLLFSRSSPHRPARPPHTLCMTHVQMCAAALWSSIVWLNIHQWR